MSEKYMKQVDTDINDELCPEYDLRRLRVRKLGQGRRSFGGVIRLEPDVAEVFPDAAAVNEALRFLIRVTKANQPIAHPKATPDNRVQRMRATQQRF